MDLPHLPLELIIYIFELDDELLLLKSGQLNNVIRRLTYSSYVKKMFQIKISKNEIVAFLSNNMNLKES
jgi:hypothetical protein